MKLILLAWVIVVLLSAPPVAATEQQPHDEQREEPRRAMPHPPQSPLRFTQARGNERQSLEVTYIDPKTIVFRLAKSGTCSRHEQGRAKIISNWWLGAETDENEAGEAIAVQEYTFSKNSKCNINFRIDEGKWGQATVREAAACNAKCPASAEPMHLFTTKEHPYLIGK
ncbi:hypothetical protein KP001_12225 [Geomonas subterranea]|uniref:Uncharacterized protein n=1 Tax=Geomonas subterranea TaxID=2847989 RepID=A0ABX8LB46_9BACT|nr:hypothetical protein [Geomonas subterranea]QXE89227.1 hypothetical protein KP001_12225 [Geomonas subterranea]QXM08661.1 hypothetical protein KP002_17050 [Geomonas subterranea]